MCLQRRWALKFFISCDKMVHTSRPSSRFVLPLLRMWLSVASIILQPPNLSAKPKMPAPEAEQRGLLRRTSPLTSTHLGTPLKQRMLWRIFRSNWISSSALLMAWMELPAWQSKSARAGNSIHAVLFNTNHETPSMIASRQPDGIASMDSASVHLCAIARDAMFKWLPDRVAYMILSAGGRRPPDSNAILRLNRLPRRWRQTYHICDHGHSHTMCFQKNLSIYSRPRDQTDSWPKRTCLSILPCVL